MKTENPLEEGLKECPGCHQMVDHDVCWCGDPEKYHGVMGDHSFVPMGCDCMRVKNDQD